MRISDWSSDVCSSDLGQRDRGFYLRLLIGCYAIGFTLRGVGLAETLSFSPGPRTIWFTAEVARLALGLGHVSLINLAVQTRFGSGLLRPFKAAGRVALRLYFLKPFGTEDGAGEN